MPLRYTTLEPSRSEIRVLQPRPHLVPRKHLKASECEAPLAFDVHIVSLDEEPRFVALSYVWGDATKTRPISVNGTEVQVTLNLYDTLHWHSHAHGSKISNLPLWADAICINQVDLDEKSRQIQLMARIYKHAVNTICWLGPSTPQIADYIRWGRCLSVPLSTSAFDKVFGELRSFSWIQLRVRSFLSKRASTKYLLRYLRVNIGEIQLLCLEYFQRMWTAQECILSEEKAIFVLGGEVSEITPHSMGRTMSIGNGRFWNLDNAFKIAQEMAARSQTEAKLAIQITEELCNPMPSDAQHVETMRGAWYSFRHAEGHGVFALYTLLIATHLRACQDPRDRVFGLLGLLKNHGNSQGVQENLLSVDYDKPPDQVFLDAVYYVYTTEYYEGLHSVLESFLPRRSLVHDAAAGAYHISGTVIEDGPLPSTWRPVSSWLTDFSQPDKRVRFKILLTTTKKVLLSSRLQKVQWLRFNPSDNAHPDRLVVQGKTLGVIRRTIHFPDCGLGITKLACELLYEANERDRTPEGYRTYHWPEWEPLVRTEVKELVSSIAVAEDLVMRFGYCLRETGSLLWRFNMWDIAFWCALHRDLTSASESTLEHAPETTFQGVDTGQRWKDALATLRHNERAIEMLSNHALFVLDNGTFGLCSATVEEGDTIVLSANFNKCLVLRAKTPPRKHGNAKANEEIRPPKENLRTSSHDPTYELIDWAYVDGVSYNSARADFLDFVTSQPWQEMTVV